MSNVVKLLIVLAVLAFLAAVYVAWSGPLMDLQAESLSRASSNLSLIAIALAVSDRIASAP